MHKLMEQIQTELLHTEDLIIRPFELDGARVHLMYIETLCDKAKLELSVFKQWFRMNSNVYDSLEVEQLVTAANSEAISTTQDGVHALLEGKGLVGFDNSENLFAFNAEQSNVRSIQLTNFQSWAKELALLNIYLLI
jgi:hypothetical protein